MENDGVSVVAGFNQHASHDRDKPALFDTITGAVLIYVLTDQLKHFATFPCAQHAKVAFSGTIVNKIPTISCAAHEMVEASGHFLLSLWFMTRLPVGAP